MQKYKEINGNDYVKNSRTTINETMQSIQSMNSGTAFPTNNLFEGMKCYRTDLKKTYTLTDAENNTWVEDAHATLSDEATHAASATKLQTARSLNLGGAVTADAATFDGTANATINVKTLDATKLKGTASVSTTGNAATATKVVATAAAGASANIAEATMASNDLARIRVSGETNAGELALETADDGSEPIVARQYTGAYTNAVRTAKILDESGNTSFPGTVVAPKFTGALNGNAATATKLSTERKINITGNATGSAGFDGTSDVNINVTVNSATKAVNDGNGANIASTYVKKAGDTTTGKITFAATDLNTLPEVKKTSDDNMSGVRFSSKTKFLGAVGKRLSNGEDLLNLRSDNTTTDVVLDSRNYNNYAPTKTGGGASGTWGINISGNAASATTAGNVSGKIYYSSDSPSVATDKLFTVKQAHAGEDNVPNNGLVIQSGPTGANYNGKLYITDNGGDGVWVGGVAAGKEVGWTRLVENKGSWNINSATATKLATARAISLTGNASGSANFDGSGNVSINTNVNYAGQAKKLADESGSNYLKIDTTDDSWSVIGPSLGNWLKSIRTYKAPPYSIGNFSAAIAFGGGDTKGIITHAYNSPDVKFAGGNGSTASWKFTIHGGSNNEYYDLNNFPTKTGGGASGTWGISISGNADTVDGYHASDLLGKIYPVGSIYMSMSATNPHDLFGVGTWKRISQGRMLLGADDSTYKAGATGGEATHTLTVNEIPAHSHGISTSGDHSHYFYGSDGNNGPLTEGDGLDTEANKHYTHNERYTTSSAGAHTHTISNSGGGAAHNNMSPYLVCYIWQRTA